MATVPLVVRCNGVTPTLILIYLINLWLISKERLNAIVPGIVKDQQFICDYKMFGGYILIILEYLDATMQTQK